MDRRNIKINARIFCSKVISAIALAMTLLLLPLAQAQPTQSVASTPDEVFRIVIAEQVGEKEGRDNRLMLETLGYIPVHQSGDFDASKGVVTLGNFVSEKEAQKIREQLVRDGFQPLRVVRVHRSSEFETGFFTVRAEICTDEATALQYKNSLEKSRPNLIVRIHKEETVAQYSVLIGFCISRDKATSIQSDLRTNLGYPRAEIISVLSGLPVPRHIRTASADASVGTSCTLSEDELRELEELIKLKHELSGSQSEHSGLTDVLLRNSSSADLKRHRIVLEAQKLAMDGHSEAAKLKLREMLALDPDDPVLRMRVETLEKILFTPPSESAADQNYPLLKAAANWDSERDSDSPLDGPSPVRMAHPMTGEEQAELEKRKKKAVLFREANELAKSDKMEAALIKIREILAMDPTNPMAIQRERILSNISYDADPLSEFEVKYEALKKEATNAESAGTLRDLIRARANWREIANLHDRHREQAKAEFARISKRIDKLIRASESK